MKMKGSESTKLAPHHVAYIMSSPGIDSKISQGFAQTYSVEIVTDFRSASIETSRLLFDLRSQSSSEFGRVCMCS